MHILLVTERFEPESNPGAIREYEHCRRWVAAGASVTVLTSVPNFPTGKPLPPYRNKLYQREMLDGIQVVRVWTFLAANRGVILRALDFLSFAISSFLAGLREQPDIIIATSPQLLAVFSGCLLARVKRKPWIFEVRDLWPDSIVAVGLMRENFLIRALHGLEVYLYRKATCIVAVTEGIARNIESRASPLGKVIVVHNGADTKRFSPRVADVQLRNKYDLSDSYVVGYIGALGLSQGLETLIDAASILRNVPIRFLLIGDGAHREHLRSRAAALKLSNVSFLDAIPAAAVPDHIATCDSMVVLLKDHSVFALAVPTKLYEAASMERPIIAGVRGEAADLIRRYNAGLVVEPEDPIALAQAIDWLRQNSDFAREAAKGGRRLADDFDRSHLADRMLQEIKAVLRDAPGKRPN